MKTIPAIAFLAALVAFLFSLVSFELSVSALLTLGIVSILAADYRVRRPLVARAPTGVPRKRSPLPLAV